MFYCTLCGSKLKWTDWLLDEEAEYNSITGQQKFYKYSFCIQYYKKPNWLRNLINLLGVPHGTFVGFHGGRADFWQVKTKWGVNK